MHMADALLSPVVGGTMWAVTAATIGYASKKVKERLDDRQIPLMGVLGAFIFAAQMINFTIPGTGSSGHLGGGMILAILLGSHAAFLVMASILTVQALFFADGGLLALGCNIVNLGILPCYIAYPLLYCRIAGPEATPGRIAVASMVAAIVGLQLGAFAVVSETVLSGISALPFSIFVLVMQPIHLAIGLVEGMVTAVLINFIRAAEPEFVGRGVIARNAGMRGYKKILIGLFAATALMGGVLSWFASSNPDGLEWAMEKVSGQGELEAPEHGIHHSLARLQEKLAFLPDYSFKKGEKEKESAIEKQGASPVKAGTGISGLVGGFITLAVVAIVAILLRQRTTTAR